MKSSTTLGRIREIVEAWKREDVATLAAMDTIDGILIEQEQRRKRVFSDIKVPMEVGE